jgi:hypothetical protein
LDKPKLTYSHFDKMLADQASAIPQLRRAQLRRPRGGRNSEAYCALLAAVHGLRAYCAVVVVGAIRVAIAPCGAMLRYCALQPNGFAVEKRHRRQSLIAIT